MKSNGHRSTGAVFAVAVFLLAVTPLAVVAADRFTDVGDDNVFHDDIKWLADADVTRGCNPPSNTRYCPKDSVTREQMAAFMRRLAENQVVDAGSLEGLSADELRSGSAGVQITDFSQDVTITSTAWTEILSVEAAVSTESNVVLAAHVYAERLASGNARYKFKIARDDCESGPVGETWWRPFANVGGFQAEAIALTGFDTVAEPTTYVFCATKHDAGGPDLIAEKRGLTATWTPTQ